MPITAAAMVLEMREDRRMTKSVFARLVGVPLSTITRIESGAVDPTWTMLSRIITGAGFSFADTLADAGGDEIVASTVARLRGPRREETLRDLPSVANAARLVRRKGRLIYGLDRSLPSLLDAIRSTGQIPVISSFEAFTRNDEILQSFIPVVYVDDPEALVDVLPPRSPEIGSSVIVLPTTPNSAANTDIRFGSPMMNREWAAFDAFASPGRQADVAMELIPELQAAAA